MRRVMRTLLIIILIILIIAAVAAAGWLVYSELTSYAAETDQQFDQQENKVQSLEALIDEHRETLEEQQEQLGEQIRLLEEQEQGLNALRQSAVEKEQLADVAGALDENIVNLDEMRLALTMQINGLVTDTQTLTQTVTLIDEGQAVLNQDLSNYSRTLDDLGLKFNSVITDVTVLKESDASLTDGLAVLEDELSAADVDGIRQAVYLFRLWEMITRARIRLAEQNPGLAAGDVELAHTAVSEFIENSPEEYVEPLIRVERRLLLAAENLADDPELAISDLDLAWRELDLILVEILGMPGGPADN